MKIVEVGYGRTYNIGNYESERIDVRIRLDDGDTCEDAYIAARTTVHAEFVVGQEDRKAVREAQRQLGRIKNDIYEADRRYQRLNGLLNEAGQKYVQLRQLLVKNGVEIAELPANLLPDTPAANDFEDQGEDEDDGE